MKISMTKDEIRKYISCKYQGLNVTEAYLETTFFYNPEMKLPRGVYFATIKEVDGPNDKSSNLNRNAVFRLSIGIGDQEYLKLFGQRPKRPAKGKIIDGDWDFSQLNVLTPHPIYGWLGWVAINNPQGENLIKAFEFIDTAYNNAILKFNKRKEIA